MKSRRRFRGHRQRTGGAMIEFVLCLPVYFAIAIATVETCRMVYLRQSLRIAAYECARLGITPGITADVIHDQCDVILQGRGLTGYELNLTPADPRGLEYEELLTVSISMPVSENGLMGSWLSEGRVLDESITIMAEY